MLTLRHNSISVIETYIRIFEKIPKHKRTRKRRHKCSEAITKQVPTNRNICNKRRSIRSCNTRSNFPENSSYNLRSHNVNIVVREDDLSPVSAVFFRLITSIADKKLVNEIIQAKPYIGDKYSKVTVLYPGRKRFVGVTFVSGRLVKISLYGSTISTILEDTGYDKYLSGARNFIVDDLDELVKLTHGTLLHLLNIMKTHIERNKLMITKILDLTQRIAGYLKEEHRS